MAEIHRDSLIQRHVVENIIGFGRSKIYSFYDEKNPSFDPTFPKPVRLGSSVRWVAGEVLDWVHARISERDSSAVR